MNGKCARHSPDLGGIRWCIAVLFAGCALLAPAPAPAQQEAGDAHRPAFVAADCPFPVSEADLDAIRCGHVEVPEEWANPGGRRIRVAVTVFRATAPSAGREAIVRIAGGPTPALQGAAAAITSPLRRDRDLINFDYRGMGAGDAVCPDLGSAYFRALTGPRDTDASREAVRGLVRECRQWADDHGADLAAYHARNMAHDVVAIVSAFQYDAWSIVAVSFGTLVAQHVLRMQPAGLRAVTLAGPLPANAEAIETDGFARALDLVATYCARQPACAAAFPDPVGGYDALYERLEREPLRVPVAVSEAFPAGELMLTGTALKRMVTEMLYARSALAAVPMLLRETARGNTAVAALIAGRLVQRVDGLTGANWAANCDASGAWAAAGTDGGGARDNVFRNELRDRCGLLGVPPAPPEARAPVESDVPVLIVVGEHDPVTPPAYAHAVARPLRRAYVIEMPGRGHEFPGSCTIPLILAFLEDTAAAPDASCFNSLPDIPFLGVESSQPPEAA